MAQPPPFPPGASRPPGPANETANVPASARRLVVAIDGPAGAGKSTVARMLAERLGYDLLDTGAIYRTLALLALQQGVPWDDGPRVAALAFNLDIRFRLQEGSNRVFVNGTDVSAHIRTAEISDGASRVSSLPEVRVALLDLQRRLGAAGGVVVEGRDIGTVVFPGADAKFFLTATVEERARRRTLELRTGGRAADEQSVLLDITARDLRDSTRAVAPLRPAQDSLEIDSSGITAQDVVDKMAGLIQERLGPPRR